MRDTLAMLHGLELPGGHDLDHAYRHCNLSDLARPARTPVVSGIASAVRDFLVDAGNANLSTLRLERCVVRGTERVSGAPMQVQFEGRARTLDFAARHIFGNDDFELIEARGSAADDCDVLVTDRPLRDRVARLRHPSLAVPHWFRQRVELPDSWQATLARLPAQLRKELRRRLRQRDYHARIVCDLPAKLEFCEQYLRPFVAARFGRGAVMPNRRTYQREVDVSVLFELHAGRQFLGASLLRHDADTLFVGRTAFCPDRAAPSEILDFFCLVLAQRLGCGYLDLGLTRPHLEDGVLAYKAKWRPRLVSSGALKSVIRIRPLNASSGSLGFLSRNGFIERRAGRFIVRRLLAAGEPAAAARAEIAALAARVGLDEVVLAYPGAGTASRLLPGGVRLCPLESREDPVAAFLRLP